MFNKFKRKLKDFITSRSGFSLVELIVVIAIMAVMAAVLAPSLLSYVERSRAQKDDNAMSEVTSAIQLSLADQNVYDELLPYAIKGNFSCYADGDASTNTDANKTITKAPDYWLFNDNCRLLDETAYQPAGSMRGATVTFKPNGEAEYILKDGIVNKIGDDSTKKGTNGGAVLEDCPELYNRLRSTVGDTIKVSSQTYRNSTYTIFINMGTTGGNQADKQDAIKVYGQYNGTNLPEVITATGSGTQDKGNVGENDVVTPTNKLTHANIIPEGGVYTTADGTILTAGKPFPEIQVFDKYEYQNIQYLYGQRRCDNSFYTEWSGLCECCNESPIDGWSVGVNDNASTVGDLLHSINGKSIVEMRLAFAWNNKITDLSHIVIPSNITNLNDAFEGCRKLTAAPIIPEGITSMSCTFRLCSSLSQVTINATPSSYSQCLEETFITHIDGSCADNVKELLLLTK